MFSIEMERFKRLKPDRAFHMYVIYDKPTDFPNDFVARLWEVAPDGSRPTRYMTRATSLEEIRETLPAGLVCFGRDRGDDPCVVEVWC